MVMGQWAQNIIRQEFGEIPDEVLVEPKSLLGYAVHVPGTEIRTIDIHTPITWRQKLDHWMSQMARKAGADITDGTRIVGLSPCRNGFTIDCTNKGNLIQLETKYIIGADGARSSVRNALFGGLKPTYWHCFRECYDVRLELPERRFNFFSTLETAPFYFCTHDKDNVMLMEGGAMPGHIKHEIVKSRQFLIDNHQLDGSIRPLWKDSCVEPILYRELFSREFQPVKENALLVGDAAGLNMPVTGEGVGTSLLSGREAANAIIDSSRNVITASDKYMITIDKCLTRFQEIYQFSKRIKQATNSGDPSTLSRSLTESWDFALKVFDTDFE
jgi:flavin-dependent dehydrogenase